MPASGASRDSSAVTAATQWPHVMPSTWNDWIPMPSTWNDWVLMLSPECR